MSDYGGFRAIVQEARDLDRQNREAPLVDCPVCGEPLVRRADGLANCPLGHFRTRAKTKGELGAQ